VVALDASEVRACGGKRQRGAAGSVCRCVGCAVRACPGLMRASLRVALYAARSRGCIATLTGHLGPPHHTTPQALTLDRASFHALLGKLDSLRSMWRFEVRRCCCA
jgi:hypothetical protein